MVLEDFLEIESIIRTSPKANKPKSSGARKLFEFGQSMFVPESISFPSSLITPTPLGHGHRTLDDPSIKPIKQAKTMSLCLSNKNFKRVEKTVSPITAPSESIESFSKSWLSIAVKTEA